MAFSIQRAVSDGTMTLLPISIEYFDREEISVLFNGVLNARQWAWVGTTDKTLSFTPAVANAVEVMIVRSTDLAELRHQFSLGAQFTAESLDESLLQILHIAQEAKEGSNLGEIFQNLNFHGFKAINMGNGSDPGDAVNHAQMEVHDATIVGYMNTTEGYKDAAAASAAAALVSETNAASVADTKIAAHVALSDPHTQYARESDLKTVNGASLLGGGNITVGVADGDKGDITVSSTGTVWTIDAGAVSPAKLTQPFTAAPAQASTSGTALDFTGIPAWVKRVSVVFAGVSTNGASNVLIQIGPSGGVETTGYSGGVIGSGGSSAFSTGILTIAANAASVVQHGKVDLVLVDSTSNTWAFSGTLVRSDSLQSAYLAGSKALAGPLGRLRVGTVGGTDTFDLGIVNIVYD